MGKLKYNQTRSNKKYFSSELEQLCSIRAGGRAEPCCFSLLWLYTVDC